MSSQEPSHPAPAVLPSSELISQDLICSVCLTVPVDPWVFLPCEHVFCKNCIKESIRHDPRCPVDRHAGRSRRLTPGTFIYRQWSSIAVKCANHNVGCAWTGSMGDYVDNHWRSCPSSNSRKHRARDNTGRSGVRVQELEEELSALRRRCNTLEGELESARDKLRGVPSFEGNYRYDRFDVVKLSQLISLNLEDKPEDINPNQIFNCIKNIYDDYRREWGDNPPHFEVDLKMLLATCYASNWFTDRQCHRIGEWTNILFGNGDYE